mgnify:CR=1 FL=1
MNITLWRFSDLLHAKTLLKSLQLLIIVCDVTCWRYLLLNALGFHGTGLSETAMLTLP